jgi:signal transduction histidine kinase
MKSIGSRLTTWYVAVVMVTMICAILLGRLLMIKEMFRGYDVLNAAEFQEIRSRVEEGPGPIPRSELLARVAAHARIDAALYLFQIRGADGRIIFRSDNLGASVLDPNPPGAPNWTTRCDDVGPVRVSEFQEGPLTVQIASPLRTVDHLFKSYFEVGLIVMGMVLAMSIFFGLWLKNMALAPIRRIQRTAVRITGDNLGERIPVGEGNDEVSDLARLLNQMFQRLELSFFQLWRFAGNASHELKTPLSIIRLQSEKLLMQGGLSSAQQESVQQQLEGISRLTTVIEKLLFLARSEVGAVHMNLKAQSTGALIRAFSEDASVLCEEARIELVIAKNIETEATFDAALMRQVLLNLLSNALRYTPAGGRVTLSSWVDDAHWRVSVEDTGPGMPAAALEEVFQPFVRAAQPAPTAAAEDGAGLGLAICRSILLLHHGSIRGENRVPAPGFRISFAIPCAQTKVPPPLPQWIKHVPSPEPEPVAL